MRNRVILKRKKKPLGGVDVNKGRVAMSSIKELLLEDMKQAMKERSQLNLEAIRTARAAIKNEEIAKRKDLSDKEVRSILVREINLKKEAREEYKRLGQEKEASKLEQQIAVLERYLSPDTLKNKG